MSNCISVTQNLKKEFVNSFFEYFYNSQENNWFLGIGNPIPWSFDREISNSESIYFGSYNFYKKNLDEIVPNSPDSDQTKLDFYRTCTAMKKISNDDVSFLIEKSPWKQNTIYYPYRHDQEMFLLGKRFYAYNENNRCVYKCIENTSLGPSAGATDAGSLYIPSSTSTEIIDTLDGYKWKLMYQLSAADELKFSVNGRSDLDSYIPVKYINYDPPAGSEESLQKSVQDAASNGSLSSIYVNQIYYNSFKFDPNLCVVGTTDPIYAQSNASIGATSVDIDYFGSNSSLNSLKDMLMQVVDGPGVGQVRPIRTSQRIKTGGQFYLKIGIDALDEALSAYSPPSGGSVINIIPSIKIFGDGTGLSGSSAKYSSLESALAIPKFDDSGILKGTDLLDIGKQYTFASASIPKGITAVSSSIYPSIPDDILSVSLSPLGGHGSNAVLELGASKVVVKVSLEGSENSILNATNDFRQVAIIKNPELYSTTAIIRTSSGGTEINEGDSVPLQGSGINGYGVVSSSYVFQSNRGKEFVVRGITGDVGNYTTIDGVNIDSNDGLEFINIAGAENKQIVTLTSTSAISGSIGPRDFVVGLGNKSQGISPSYACGKVFEVSTTNTKNLLLENVNGRFIEGEKIYAYARDGSYLTNFELDKVSNVIPSNFKNSYNMTTKLTIVSETNQKFEASTFSQDELVYCFEDDSVATPTTTTPFKANAFIFNYSPDLSPSVATTNSAELEIVGNKPNSFQVGDYILYYKNNLPQYAIINSIVEPEILYGTGEVLYVQNFAGIERYPGSTEEINLVLGL